MSLPHLRRLQRWRWLELAIVLGLLSVSVVTIWWISQAELSTPRQWLLGGVAILLVMGWYAVAFTMYRTLRQAILTLTLEARQEFDALYSLSPVAYLTISEQGQVKRANPAAVQLLGDTVTDLGTRNLYDFIRVVEEGGVADGSVLAGKVAAGVTITDLELPIRTIPGHDRWVLLNVYAGADPRERLLSMTDITEQRAVDTAKSEFVALATHQLRTPIAAIRWNVELLIRSLKDTTNEKQDRYLTKIDRNVLRMLHLINDFLSVSKLEMGTYAAEPEVVGFGDYLREILDEFEEKITTKQLTMNTSVTPDTLQVAIDRRLFHIISSNLLSNAVKYTPEGGAVTVTASGAGDTFTYVVADSGIGIPESEQAELFNKFFRASNAQSQVTEGTGLGLYVVKQSVEILGGTLAVTSAENQGTTFTITIPGVVR